MNERLTWSNILYKKLAKISTNSCDRETFSTLDTDICHFHTGAETESRRKTYPVKLPSIMIFIRINQNILFKCLLFNKKTKKFILKIVRQFPSASSHLRIIDISFSAWVGMAQIIIVPLADAQFMHNQFSLRCFQLSEDCS